MNAIIGFTDIALKNEPAPEVKSYLEKVKQSSDYLLSLINDVLDMSKIENGAIFLQEENCSIDKIIDDITRLAMASREHPLLRLGISPRGALAVSRMAKACAYLHGRDYTLPEDVQEIFADVCAHRVLLSQQAKTQQSTAQDVMQVLLREVAMPDAAF